MYKVFTDQTLLQVVNIKNLLEGAHIQCELRNEYAAGAVGELSFIDSWPELWIQYKDVTQAKALLRSYLENPGQEWRCQCGELNGTAFESCWSCQLDRP